MQKYLENLHHLEMLFRYVRIFSGILKGPFSFQIARWEDTSFCLWDMPYPVLTLGFDDYRITPKLVLFQLK